ncbi:MAG: sigma 54-interacting transcriptional regulator [Planctomycetota bacterium]
MSQKILVVDDKELVRDSVATMLARTGWTVRSAADGQQALKLAAEERPDVVLTDLSMPAMDGISLLDRLRKMDENLPVILMTAYATVQTAVDAMKKGAFDYLTKPFDGDELVLTVRRAVKHARLARENEVLKTQLSRGSNEREMPPFIGETPVIETLKSQISKIAQSHGTVLIMGESGVGKEVVAQITHAMSPRAKAPFLAVNCAALSTSLLESELFGHERGAFTGAERLRKGRFELAHGGTLLLDEISEIPAGIQAKLLRVLQERAFERVGSSMTQMTDVRVLATTNRDLRRAVAEGRFRQDLYYRLNVLPISVPALRERADDVPLLCDHLLSTVARREGRPAKRFDDEAIELLKAYPWPGNVRELYNVCERACIFTGEHEVIRADIIRPWLPVNTSDHRVSMTPGRSMRGETKGATADASPQLHAAGADARNGNVVASAMISDCERNDLAGERAHMRRPGVDFDEGNCGYQDDAESSQPSVEVTAAFRRHAMGEFGGDPSAKLSPLPSANAGDCTSDQRRAFVAQRARRSDQPSSAARPGESVGDPAEVITRPGSFDGIRARPTGASEDASPEYWHEDAGEQQFDSNGTAFEGDGSSDADAILAPGRTLEEIERDVIIATLQRNDGHRLNTAKELQIGVRTLGLKLRKWKDQHLVDADL